MKFFLKCFATLSVFVFPLFAFSAFEFTPLQSVKMPNGGDFYNANILEYLANIYILAIALAGGLAVVRIVYAGIKYITSDIYGLKTQAKKDINAAVVGLLMILGIYIFLYTLNPNLVKMHLQIQPTKMIQGSGVDEFGWAPTGGGGSVSGGRAPTPGVNTPPSGGTGTEIIPTLPDIPLDPNFTDTPLIGGEDGSVLPPRETPYVPPDDEPAENSSGSNTGGGITTSLETPNIQILPNEVIVTRSSEASQEEMNELLSTYPNKKVTIIVPPPNNSSGLKINP